MPDETCNAEIHYGDSTYSCDLEPGHPGCHMIDGLCWVAA
jgi:hypothetical protein